MASAILVSCFNISICCLQNQYQLQHFIFQLSILVKSQYFLCRVQKQFRSPYFQIRYLLFVSPSILFGSVKNIIFFCNVCFYSNMILVRNSSPAKHATRHLHHQMVCFIIKELIVERDHSTAKDVTSHSQIQIF